MNREMLYNDLSGFLAMHFPCKVQKISINAGFTCPNRDGSVGYGGQVNPALIEILFAYKEPLSFFQHLIRPIAIRESLLLSSWKKESGSLYANIRK